MESFELIGGYQGRLAPRFLRILAAVTGIIVIVAVVRLFTRFILQSRRSGRLWIENGRVYLEHSHFMFGKEMRRVKQSFGPKGLLRVASEVRYPYIYLFIGLFALCAGTLTGTIAYLDGRLAGLEDWMRNGVLLVLGGLVVDFVFTVLLASRPGRTTISVTFEPNTTIRVTGVDRENADAFLDELSRRAHA
jgi:hypothetical protein